MAKGLVTVFGGTGFLGHRVVRGLAANGYAVRIAARRPETATPPDGARVQYHRVDIRDREQVRSALAGAHAAVNAVSLYLERPETGFRDIHVDGARILAEAAVQGDLQKLVHISGIGADARSESAYVTARGEGELAVRDAMPEAVLLRPSVLYGPEGGLLRTLDALTRLPLIPLFGTGETRLQPAHASDVAAACVHAVERPDAAGTTYELGGPEVFRYREILTRVLRHRRRRRLMLPVPFPVWRIVARAAAVLPNPPLTVDQVILMMQDNVVAADMPSFEALGVVPRALGPALRECLT